MTVSRRSFIQKSAIGATSATLGASRMGALFAATGKKLAWSDGMRINPEIDNTRVVCCYDEDMVESDGATAASFSDKNSFVNDDVVDKNVDQMAIRLAGKDSAEAAWQAIFMKPSGKDWNAVKVAIKVNCIYKNMMPHIAIVGKVCRVLIELGVSASNITIYDACHNAYGNGKYNEYIGDGIPEGVVVSDVTKKGEMVDVGSRQQTCARVVLEADILVNCAINKGHGQDKGGFTLTMKNHTGTMKFSCPSVNEMVDQNKSDAIIGGSPPRQQLCIVDCLWSAKQGPFANATHFTNRIVMGTLGPLVDIAVARKLREPLMDATHNDSAIATILTGFGYSEDDIEWDEFAPTVVDAKSMKKNGVTRRFAFSVTKGAFNNSETMFFLPVSARQISISIFDLKGHLLKKLQADVANKSTLVWDGTTQRGNFVSKGTYIVELSADQCKLRNTIKIKR